MTQDFNEQFINPELFINQENTIQPAESSLFELDLIPKANAPKMEMDEAVKQDKTAKAVYEAVGPIEKDMKIEVYVDDSGNMYDEKSNEVRQSLMQMEFPDPPTEEEKIQRLQDIQTRMNNDIAGLDAQAEKKFGTGFKQDKRKRKWIEIESQKIKKGYEDEYYQFVGEKAKDYTKKNKTEKDILYTLTETGRKLQTKLNQTNSLIRGIDSKKVSMHEKDNIDETFEEKFQETTAKGITTYEAFEDAFEKGKLEDGAIFRIEDDRGYKSNVRSKYSKPVYYRAFTDKNGNKKIEIAAQGVVDPLTGNVLGAEIPSINLSAIDINYDYSTITNFNTLESNINSRTDLSPEQKNSRIANLTERRNKNLGNLKSAYTNIMQDQSINKWTKLAVIASTYPNQFKEAYAQFSAEAKDGEASSDRVLRAFGGILVSPITVATKGIEAAEKGITELSRMYQGKTEGAIPTGTLALEIKKNPDLPRFMDEVMKEAGDRGEMYLNSVEGLANLVSAAKAKMNNKDIESLIGQARAAYPQIVETLQAFANTANSLNVKGSTYQSGVLNIFNTSGYTSALNDYNKALNALENNDNKDIRDAVKFIKYQSILLNPEGTFSENLTKLKPEEIEFVNTVGKDLKLNKPEILSMAYDEANKIYELGNRVKSLYPADAIREYEAKNRPALDQAINEYTQQEALLRNSEIFSEKGKFLLGRLNQIDDEYNSSFNDTRMYSFPMLSQDEQQMKNALAYTNPLYGMGIGVINGIGDILGGLRETGQKLTGFSWDGFDANSRNISYSLGEYKRYLDTAVGKTGNYAFDIATGVGSAFPQMVGFATSFLAGGPAGGAGYLMATMTGPKMREAADAGLGDMGQATYAVLSMGLEYFAEGVTPEASLLKARSTKSVLTKELVEKIMAPKTRKEGFKEYARMLWKKGVGVGVQGSLEGFEEEIANKGNYILQSFYNGMLNTSFSPSAFTMQESADNLITMIGTSALFKGVSSLKSLMEERTPIQDAKQKFKKEGVDKLNASIMASLTTGEGVARALDIVKKVESGEIRQSDLNVDVYERVRDVILPAALSTNFPSGASVQQKTVALNNMIKASELTQMVERGEITSAEATPLIQSLNENAQKALRDANYANEQFGIDNSEMKSLIMEYFGVSDINTNISGALDATQQQVQKKEVDGKFAVEYMEVNDKGELFPTTQTFATSEEADAFMEERKRTGKFYGTSMKKVDVTALNKEGMAQELSKMYVDNEKNKTAAKTAEEAIKNNPEIFLASEINNANNLLEKAKSDYELASQQGPAPTELARIDDLKEKIDNLENIKSRYLNSLKDATQVSEILRQESRKQSDIVQRPGVEEGQPQEGQAEGAVGETTQPAADTSNRNLGSQAQEIEATTKALDEKFVKGIESTIPTDIAVSMAEMQIPDMDSEEFRLLREDIAKNGIKKPIKITFYRGDNKYAVTDGNHRLIIAKELGIKNIPFEINESSAESKSAFPYAEYPEIYPSAKNPSKSLEEISSEYAKAKADGSNPELVKAVEDLIGKPAAPTAEAAPVTEAPMQVDELLKEDVKTPTGLEKVFNWLDGIDKSIDKNLKSGTLRTDISVIPLAAMQTIVKALKALVKGGMSLQDAINKIAADNKYTEQDVIGAMNTIANIEKLGLSKGITEAEVPRFDRLMTEIQGIVDKSKSRGVNEAGIRENVINYVQGSKAYEDANDVQREQLIRSINKMFGVKIPSAPRVSRLLGIQNLAKVTMTEKAALQKQLRDTAKGAREAMTAWKKASEALSEDISKLVKGGKITAKQQDAIIKKFGKVNMLSPKSTRKFVDYMAKVFNDAEYQDKLNEARKVKKAISRLAKGKDRPGNLTDIAKKFLKINPSDVEDITEYNGIANQIKESLAGTKKTKEGLDIANIIDVNSVGGYIQRVSAAQEAKLKEETNNDFKELLADTAEDGKPTLEEQVKDLQAGNSVTFTYDNESQVPEVFKDKISSRGETDGKPFVKVTVAKVLADYELGRAGKGKELSYDEMLEFLNTKDAIPKEKEKLIRAAADKAFKTYSGYARRIVEKGVDPFTEDEVNLSETKKEIVKRFMKMDLNRLSTRQAIQAIDALNNFVTNKSIARMDAVVSEYEGGFGAKEVKAKNIKSFRLRKLFMPYFGKVFSLYTTNLSELFTRMFKGVERGAFVMSKTGVADMMRGKATAETQANDMAKEYVDKMHERGKLGIMLKNVNGEEFNTLKNNVERGAVAYISRNVIGTQEQRDKEFNRRKRHLKQSIDVLLKGTEREVKLGEVYKEIYDKLGIENATSALDISKRADPKNIEGIEFWKDKWAGIFDDLAEVSEGIYNRVLGKDTDYIHDKYKRLDGAAMPDELGETDSAYHNNSGEIYKKEAGVLMRAERPDDLPKGKYIDLSFDSNNASAMYDALIDINTAAAIRKWKGFSESEEFESNDIVNAEDIRLFRERMSMYIKKVRNKAPFVDDELERGFRRLNTLTTVGAAQALGSVAAALKQTISVMPNTLINSGNLDFKAISDIDKNNFISRSGYGIANRGIASQAQLDSLNKIIEVAASSTPEKALRAIERTSNFYLKTFLVNADAWIARISWMSYYQQSLKQQGIDPSTIDWKTHEVNRVAGDYAQVMLNRQQNISDPAEAGKLFANTENTFQKLIVKTAFPFASFRLNQSTRLSNDLGVLEYWNTATKEDRIIALRSLAGFAAEMVTFRTLSAFIAIMLGYASYSTSGQEPEEDQFEKWIENIIRGQFTNTVNDVFSPLPVLDKFVQEGVFMLLEEIQNLSGITEKEQVNIFEPKVPEFYEGLGLLGITAQRAVTVGSMIDLSMLDGGVKDNFGNIKYLTDQDKELIKTLVIPALLGSVGLLPAEVNSVIRKTFNDAKKRAKTQRWFNLTEKQREREGRLKKIRDTRKERKEEKGGAPSGSPMQSKKGQVINRGGSKGNIIRR